MISWHAIPFARLVLPSALGILIGYDHPVAKSIVIFSFITVLISHQFINKRLKRLSSFKLQSTNGFLLSVFIFTWFWYFTYNVQDRHNAKHFAKIANAKNLILEIHDIQKQTNTYTRIIGHVIGVLDSKEQMHKVIGSLAITYYDSSKKFKTGDIILTNSKYKTIAAPINIDDFDYQFYMSTHGIHHELFIQHFSEIGPSNFNLWHLAQAFKMFCNKIVKSHIKNKTEYGVAEALLLGYKYDIDQNTNLAFARTGTLHVLAVSGMHVGLIFGMLTLMFAWVKKNSKWLIIRCASILFCLWLYALMSGFGASILRATVTFSLMCIGELITRKPYSVNLLFASAYIQFIFDPLCVFDPGFQLSYAAVFGILTTHKPISNLFYPKNPILKHIWSISSISIAAQVYTLPISLYYFGQFPNLFLISNLLIIPITTIAIFALIFLVLVSWHHGLSNELGKGISWLLKFNNDIADYISKHPFAVTQDLYITKIECILMYLLSIVLTIILVYKIKNLINLIVSVCILLSIINIYNSSSENTNQISEYKTKHGKIYICKSGENAIIIAPKFYKNKTTKCLNLIKNRLSRLKIKKTLFVPTTKNIISTNFKVISGHGFYFFDKKVTFEKSD